MKIIGDIVRVTIPAEMLPQAPAILQDIWCDEYTGKSYFFLDLTESVRIFLEDAKLNRHILVCR